MNAKFHTKVDILDEFRVNSKGHETTKLEVTGWVHMGAPPRVVKSVGCMFHSCRHLGYKMLHVSRLVTPRVSIDTFGKGK